MRLKDLRSSVSLSLSLQLGNMLHCRQKVPLRTPNADCLTDWLYILAPARLSLFSTLN